MKTLYTTEDKVHYYVRYKELTDAPHILVAGTTGSGKSVMLNNIIATALATKTPADIEFFMIDPKRTELRQYVGVSDFTLSRATDAEGALNLLNRAINELERRLDIMEKRNLKMWEDERLVIVIDELADLMISERAREIKRALQKILQLGRAAKVSIWAATQAPNRKVIPAELTLNFTHRIALRCISAIESRQIINVAGAETITGFGVAYILDPTGLNYEEIPAVGEDYIQDRISYWRNNPGEKIIDSDFIKKLFKKDPNKKPKWAL